MNCESMVKRLSEPLYNSQKWMRLVSVLLMVQGIFSIVSLWGILVCWIPIWMGVLLRQASTLITKAFETDDEATFITAMEKLAKYFRVFGILALITVVFFFLGLVAAILIPVFVKARQAALEATGQ